MSGHTNKLCMFIVKRAELDSLMLSTLGKIFSRLHFEIFFLFFPENRKCRILFSEKNKKNISNLSSAENAQRVVSLMLTKRV